MAKGGVLARKTAGSTAAVTPLVTSDDLSFLQAAMIMPPDSPSG